MMYCMIFKTRYSWECRLLRSSGRMASSIMANTTKKRKKSEESENTEEQLKCRAFQCQFASINGSFFWSFLQDDYQITRGQYGSSATKREEDKKRRERRTLWNQVIFLYFNAMALRNKEKFVLWMGSHSIVRRIHDFAESFQVLSCLHRALCLFSKFNMKCW
jgi:hypothetical protein